MLCTIPPNTMRTMPDYTGVTGYDSLITQTSRTANPLLYNVLDVGRPGNDDTPFKIEENLYYLVGMADSSPNYKRSACISSASRAVSLRPSRATNADHA